MRSVQVELTEEQVTWLREHAERDGTTVSALVRRAVDALYFTDLPAPEADSLVTDGEDG